ncbi:unnamed protein product, partial [Urochloa humidicola]
QKGAEASSCRARVAPPAPSRGRPPSRHRPPEPRPARQVGRDPPPARRRRSRALVVRAAAGGAPGWAPDGRSQVESGGRRVTTTAHDGGTWLGSRCVELGRGGAWPANRAGAAWLRGQPWRTERSEPIRPRRSRSAPPQAPMRRRRARRVKLDLSNEIWWAAGAFLLNNRPPHWTLPRWRVRVDAISPVGTFWTSHGPLYKD